MSVAAGRLSWTVAAALFALLAAPPAMLLDAAHGAAVSVLRFQLAKRKQMQPPPPPPAAAPRAQPLPPRKAFSEADDAAAMIPGMPDARFFASSSAAFEKALPKRPGPWLILSSGGEDGAFGAGLLCGLSASGKRPDYSVVTGVSTGALIAPFVFAGRRYDNALRDAYTKITAADVFEVAETPESFLDDWPLKHLIAKQVTPALLADIAAQYRAGRRLFVATTDLDAERTVVWNMGAIAAHGGKAALKLFRSVLLASGSVPGAFSPVLIDVEAHGKRFAEMNVDGGLGGQFFAAPAALLAAKSDYRLPATRLYVVIDTGLRPEFQVVPRNIRAILSQSVDTAVKVDTRLMIDRVYAAATRSGVPFHIATIPPSFRAPSRGAFDPKYMGALFETGYDMGKGAAPFASEPPRYRESPASQGVDSQKAGAR